MDINNTKRVVKKLDLASQKSLYELWKKTPGLSIKGFCRQQGIASSTFFQWCKKFDNNIKTKSNWIPVNIPQQANKQLELSKIVPLELSFPNNMKATINISINEVVNLIKELYYATTVIR